MAQHSSYGLAAVLILAQAVVARGEESTRCLNMACLDDAQDRSYVEVERAISSGITGCKGAEACVARVIALDKRITELPDLPESAPFFLRHFLAEQLTARFEVPDPVFLALLDSPGPAQDAAITALFRTEKWDSYEPLRAKLLALLHEDATSGDTRVSILWMFRQRQQFETVQADALALARDSSDVALARAAAAVYVMALLEDAHQTNAVRGLAAEDAGVISEVAAEQLLGGRYEPCDSTAFPLLVKRVARLAESPNAEPQARGEAIDVLVGYDTDPNVVPVLIRLLSPAEWFFGAAGQHFPVHSLAKLIVPLSDSANDQIQGALGALPSLVHSIPEAEGRDYVKWEIDNWVLKRR